MKHTDIIVGAIGAAALAGAVAGWTWHEQHLAAGAATLFSVDQPGCAIVLPAVPTAAEERAAITLQRTLSRASGRANASFPIRREGAGPSGPSIRVGATRWAQDFLRPRGLPPFDHAVGTRSRAGVVAIRAEHRDGIEGAVGWFLEQQVGAQWFVPGPPGEHVERRSELRIAAGETVTRPGFVSRSLGAVDPEWFARNGLEARLDHGHNLDRIFPPDELRRRPELAPLRSGTKFLPQAGDYNWQPDLLHPAAVEGAAQAAIRAFEREPARLSFSLSINDSVLFDQSAATLAARGPAAHFRGRPDYSNLVFGFTNAVANRVAERFPDKWLPAYAYYWCENVPSFPVARNVVPFLTADRTQWSHPAFAAEDRALIERWCRSGAALVGVYDYYYGMPYFVPRPMVDAVRETIPFMYRAGVRAFYAEAYSNWALDGPKPWLAAKLLWSPERSVEDLLDLYYRAYWAEAAGPMRAFFELCDRTWQELPGPPLWLRYFNDSDQVHIYSAERWERLRALVDEARRMAHSPEVRARVALTAAGFSVAETFVAFARARNDLGRLTQREADADAVIDVWRRYREARDQFVRRYAEVRRDEPTALAQQSLDSLLRDQPDSRTARFLSRSGAGRERLRREAHLLWSATGVSAPEFEQLEEHGVEMLQDGALRTMSVREVASPAAIDWTVSGERWVGVGEPWETRRIAAVDRPDGERALRIAGSRNDQLGQWVAMDEGVPFLARVGLRAKSSPGTLTALVVSFCDAQGRYLGAGIIDRLPAGSAEQMTDLCVAGRTPPGTRAIGVFLRVLHQLPDDYAEFAGPSLRTLARDRGAGGAP